MMNTPLILCDPEVPDEDRLAGTEVPAETLVRDQRAGLTPAQLVERKLSFLLKGNALPMSLGHTTNALPLRPPGPRSGSSIIFPRE
jgi:hypothetical protein